MRRLVHHDICAFEALYDAHHRLVFAIGLRLLGDAESAEEMTQGVFLKVWAYPERFRGGSLVAWLARVSRNASLDVLRQRSARREVEITADTALDAAVEDVVMALFDAQRVRSALLRLPAAERIPIEMGFFGGLTYRAVASEIGLPIGTVKTRIRAGLRHLRDLLKQNDEAGRLS